MTPGEELLDQLLRDRVTLDQASQETLVYRQMLGQWLADVRREARLEVRPPRLDERDEESLRALGYLR